MSVLRFCFCRLLIVDILFVNSFLWNVLLMLKILVMGICLRMWSVFFLLMIEKLLGLCRLDVSLVRYLLWFRLMEMVMLIFFWILDDSWESVFVGDWLCKCFVLVRFKNVLLIDKGFMMGVSLIMKVWICWLILMYLFILGVKMMVFG